MNQSKERYKINILLCNKKHMRQVEQICEGGNVEHTQTYSHQQQKTQGKEKEEHSKKSSEKGKKNKSSRIIIKTT
jgi:hypothetical protein